MDLRSDESILYLNCANDYKNLYMIKLHRNTHTPTETHTQMNMYRSSKI